MTGKIAETEYDLTEGQHRWLRALHDRKCWNREVLDTQLSDEKPVPEFLLEMFLQGLITYGRGRCGPLGIYTGSWVIGLTDKAAVYTKLRYG